MLTLIKIYKCTSSSTDKIDKISHEERDSNKPLIEKRFRSFWNRLHIIGLTFAKNVFKHHCTYHC